jgi:phage FluMu protein Com
MTNFLNIHCPKCWTDNQIDIAATVWLRVTENGTDADESKDGQHDYTPRSDAACNACGYYGRLQDFEQDEEAEIAEATV